MKFIIVDNRIGTHRSFNASRFLIGLTVAGLIGIPGFAAALAYEYGQATAGVDAEMIGKWRDVLKAQREEVKGVQRMAAESLEASAVRLAKLQARIVRLDALGERLTSVADLEEGEFDFSQPPALGGPLSEGEEHGAESVGVLDYMTLLDQVASDLESRERQLDVLETLLVNRKISNDVFIAGRPVEKGWMSSRFGTRNDPITGKRAWHSGVDFAGKEGSNVVSVAAGVVVYSGDRSGYGKLVEINHGSGFSTLYGHHKELLVGVGDIVKKGQVIGLMGSSGRATGPHVHFEVYKNGRVVDPSSYVQRASR
ncbi:MAG: M23 family metallopeptidase [Proteobacteria bacterium]|jgi:murein DD-endopeptidase MepM/ murein hydrolase activator NlpD|nr:M23 family metallopeptidase [Pseudomonadota bacterium]MDA1299086.1 M23 family metallopeptidase [Pseudomonadota bacterium]